MEIVWEIFFRGFIAGLVAVLGLVLGVKILLSTSDPAKSFQKSELIVRYFVSALILGGQFILAAWLLIKGKPTGNLSDNISLGLGLIFSIFLTTLGAIPFFMKKRKKH
jgi:hypothetical protein